MSVTSRRALAVPAIVALAAVAATAPATAGSAGSAGSRGPLVRTSGPLSDLQTAGSGPFDGARATVQIVASRNASHTVLRVRGIDGADGQTFGAHLHAGPCVAGDGAAALGHYNTDVEAGILPPLNRISEDTEVWLDITVHGGAGNATASVPFVPEAGRRSVVIHALATDHHTGLAGARLACLPVEW